MADEIKRMNYFTGQFLDADDFKAEQNYHIDMRHRLNRSFRGPGIVDNGFTVKVANQLSDTEPARIIVEEGIGIDNFGQELVIISPVTKEISKVELDKLQGKSIFVCLIYGDLFADSDKKAGYDNVFEFTRVTERPVIILQAKPDTKMILLANLVVDSNNNIVIDNNVRQLAPLMVNGNVGIGTSAPQQQLSIQGGLNVDQANVNNGTLQPGISFGDRSGEGISSKRTTGGNQYGLDFYTRGGTVRLSISNGGNVGIGTVDIKRTLHVEGGEIHSGGGGAGFSFGDRTVTGFIETPPVGQRWVWYATSGIARLWSGTDKLCITAAGNVGIGTVDIKRTLHVEGSEIHSGGGGAGFSFGDRTVTGFIETPPIGQRWVWYASSGIARLWSGTDKLCITAAGNVGVGTSAPQQMLSVQGGLNIDQAEANNGVLQPGIRFGSGSGEGIASKRTPSGNQWGLDFYTGSCVRLSISNTGLVDIGTNPIRFSSGWTGSPDGAGVTNRAEISNDTGTFKTLMIVGNKSNGGVRRVSVWDRLEVNGSLFVNGEVSTNGNVDIGTNPIRFSSGWTGSPDGAGVTNRAEISNDTGTFKTLMIVGNKSNGGVRRVSVWDRLEVNGTLLVNGEVQTTSANAFRMVQGNYGAFFRNDGNATYLLLTNSGDQYGGWNGLRPFCVENATGKVIIASDIVISGKIGNMGHSPVPRNPGWGGGIHTWDIEAEGSIWCAHTIHGSNVDLAENYFSDMDLEAGDVVSFDPKEDKIVLSSQPAERFVCGVISTAPGFLLNANPAERNGKWYPLALTGRVPCKVTDENGPIRRGDLLSSSSLPGYAMKAKPILVSGEVIYPAGTIIGKSMDDLESGQGLVDIFVCLR
jgi:hypothetical protein